MAEYTLIGNRVTLESSVPIIDPQNGLFWKEVYSGPQDALYSQRDLLNIQPDQRVDIQQKNGPIYSLTVVTPDYVNGQSSALEKFDLIRHDVEKSILDHPMALNLADGEGDFIRQLIRDKKKISEITFPSDVSAIIYSKFLLGGGNAKYLDFERTFKFSIVTSGRYGSLVSEFMINKLWTAEQIITPSYSGIIFPNNMRFDLLVIDANMAASNTALYGTPYIDKKITAPGRTPNPLIERYSWKWLKAGGEVENLPNGKLRLNQEFLGALWSEREYGFAT